MVLQKELDLNFETVPNFFYGTQEDIKHNL